MSCRSKYAVTVSSLLVAAVLLCLHRYEFLGPMLDTSTDSSFHESMASLRRPLDQHLTSEFNEAVNIVSYSDSKLVRVLSGIGLHVKSDLGRRKLHGLTASQTIDLADCIRSNSPDCAEPKHGYLH